MLSIQIMMKFYQKHVTRQARSHTAGVSLQIKISSNQAVVRAVCSRAHIAPFRPASSAS